MNGSPTEKSSNKRPASLTEIELNVVDIKQLFDAMDPSPMAERDLDTRVETFIVNSAKDLPRDATLGLVVHFGNKTEVADFVPDAIHQHFRRCGEAARRRLREHFRYGRMALCIGLSFLSFSLGTSILAENWLNLWGLNVIKESLGIAGWVSMWRPAEIFLYDWWPILAEARLYERLAAMPVRVNGAA